MDIFETHNHYLSEKKTEYEFIKLIRYKNIINDNIFYDIIDKMKLTQYNQSPEKGIIEHTPEYSEDRLLDTDTEIFSEEE